VTDLRFSRLRRFCVYTACAAAAWAAVVGASGGISIALGPVHLSTRNPRNPTLVALLALAAAWTLAPKGSSTRAIADDCRLVLARLHSCLVHLPPVLASLLALAVVTIGLREGALVAAGSDASGYVTHAHLWATGRLQIDVPLMGEVSPTIPREVFAPLAYRPALRGDAIVPVTAPGLPMVMALFEVAGGSDAVFAVVPLMAGAAIVATYLLGATIAGPWAGCGAAALLGASPSFLFQLTSSPMSDIPAMTCWAFALAYLLREGGRAALIAGLCAGAAVLTRPNLVPLAVPPVVLLAWTALRERHSGALAQRRLLLFAAGVVPACLAIAWLYNYWYGSPLSSGYGNVAELYRWQHLPVNLSRYSRWLIESQTPLVLLSLTVPFVARSATERVRAVVMLCFIAVVFACYMFYLPFDAWWFLRFLLPAYPPLLVMTTVAIAWFAARTPRGIGALVAIALVGAAAWHGVQYARAGAAFHVEGEWKYATAGRYVAEQLPAEAVLLAMQHSGSARYYSNHVTLQYRWIPATKLDELIAELRRLHREPYLLLEDWEEADFRARFAGQRTVETLARVPLAELSPGAVRIYKVPEFRAPD
jgi:hypothetical protein